MQAITCQQTILGVILSIEGYENNGKNKGVLSWQMQSKMKN